MSTLTSPERPHSVTPHLATMDQATTSIDAAASLRALALSTLKKRKTTTATAADTPASLPSRPIPHDNSIHLDYGTEESSFGASTIASSSAGPSTTVKIPSPPQATPMDVDDDQTREEGEISDSESTPTPKPPQTPPKTVPAKPQPTAPSLPMKPRSSPLAKSAQLSHTDASTRPKSDISAPLRGQQTTHLAPSSLPYTPPDHDMSIVEDTQVRPGLVMTQAQYDKSKDIVLDLLGWGVPPEYLVTCGLSREIIYYIFLDLNLRLPTNLDMTGLPQLPTAEPLRYTSPEPISPPIAPSFNRQRSQSASTRQTQVHPSLPLKPTAPQGPTTAEGSSLSATATPFVPSTPPAPDQATSLIDMELQRRQELLARKAVLASRKSKQATLAVPAARSTLESRISDAKDVTMAEPPSVPKQAVDDFLNSIPSASHAPQDDMDVDGPIPGLSSKPPGLAPSPQILEPPSSISATSSSGDLMFQSSAEASLFSTPRQTLATDRESVGRSSSVSDEKSDVSEPLTREPSIGVRRGTKRPVASDFVDMEPGPSRSHHNGYNNHQSAPHGHHYHARKRPQSFAGVATSRRMVIDLSDTSDDDDDEDGTGSSWATRHQHRPRQPHRLAVSNSVPSIGSPSGSATPAALQEKEEAIKKMRELIAQRERARKDKLAARPTPPVVPNSEQVQQVTVTVKQEEDDNTASASLADPTSAPLDPKVESDDLISKPATPVPSRSLTPGDPPRSPGLVSSPASFCVTSAHPIVQIIYGGPPNTRQQLIKACNLQPAFGPQMLFPHKHPFYIVALVSVPARPRQTCMDLR
ncbi:hypothetical protein BDW22DRAFT_660240 [Trametopsis cervina]|nr:hypothetical protein BDW22DRAFT_660240 [Trametopsis cervina]